jgi:hypothetical protein
MTAEARVCVGEKRHVARAGLLERRDPGDVDVAVAFEFTLEPRRKLAQSHWLILHAVWWVWSVWSDWSVWSVW